MTLNEFGINVVQSHLDENGYTVFYNLDEFGKAITSFSWTTEGFKSLIFSMLENTISFLSFNRKLEFNKPKREIIFE